MQTIDAQLVCQVIEVGVVGAHDRRVHIHPTIAAVVPVAVLVIEVRQLVITRVEDSGLWRDNAGVEPGNRHFGLDGRTRRVETAQHTVEQWPVDGIAQRRVLLGADTGDEQIWVETWIADHGQHFAGRRIERDDRTTAITQGVFGGFLKLDVEAQYNVFARHRISVLEHAQYAALGIGFDFLVTDMAV
ncbi:hypothetical protein D3C87_1664660 [compost metagenome]